MALVAEEVSLEIIGVCGRRWRGFGGSMGTWRGSCGGRIAAGSAREAQRCLLAAEAWGYVERASTAVALRQIDRELAHPRRGGA